jgi:hypothetical protein
MMFTTAHFTIHMSGHLHLGFRGRAGNVEALVKYGRMFGLDRIGQGQQVNGCPGLVVHFNS